MPEEWEKFPVIPNSTLRPFQSPCPRPYPVSGCALPAVTGFVLHRVSARGCQARRHDVEDNVMSGCQAPPVNAPSRPSRRGPPRQRHADCGFPAEDASWGAANSKFEIRNSKFRGASIDRLDGRFDILLTEHAIGSRTESGSSAFDVVEVAPDGRFQCADGSPPTSRSGYNRWGRRLEDR